MCEIVLKKGYMYIDIVGEDNVEIYMKVSFVYFIWLRCLV